MPPKRFRQSRLQFSRNNKQRSSGDSTDAAEESKAWVRQFNARQNNPEARLSLRKLPGSSKQTRLHLRKAVISDDDDDIQKEDAVSLSSHTEDEMPSFASPRASALRISDDDEDEDKALPGSATKRKLKRKAEMEVETEERRQEEQKKKNREALAALMQKSLSLNMDLCCSDSLLEAIKSKKRSDPDESEDLELPESEDSYADGMDSDDFLASSSDDGADSTPPYYSDPTLFPSNERSKKKKVSKKRILHLDFHDSSSESASDGTDPPYGDDEETERQRRPRKVKRNAPKPVDWRDEMPVEFSGISKQPISHAFNTLVQMLASEALEPGFIKTTLKSKDDYFLIPMDKLDSMVESKKFALGLSSIWDPQFKADLEKYPHLNASHLPPFDRTVCTACNRSGRIATILMTLSGHPYDRQTLALSKKERNHSVSYELGRHCKRRSQIYHTLHHYKWTLYEDISAQVDILLKNRAMSNATAAEILEHLLGDTSYLNSLFHQFKTMLDNVESYADGDE